MAIQTTHKSSPSRLRCGPVVRSDALFLMIVLLIMLGVLAGPSAVQAWDNGGWSTIFSPLAKTDDVRSVSDGFGGILVAVHDPGEVVFKVSISRLDHTGRKLWGPDGVNLPYDLTSTGMGGPVDIVADDSGGAYCLFTEFYTGGTVVSLARLDSGGTVLWKQVVGDYGPHPVMEARIIRSDGGDLLVAWNRSVGTVDLELVATRLDADGNPIWETTVWSDGDGNLDQLYWTIDTDGFGGLVFGLDYTPFGELYQGRVQRLAGNGTLMWGATGTQVWSSMGDIVAVLPDGAGGAHVMNSLGWGSTRAQHVDVFGAETWVVGGIQLFTLNTWPTPAEPAFCSDGGGGFYAVDGVEDLYAQHVDVVGNLLWGSTGLQITTLPGWQEHPHLTPDGFGGALIVYRDHYYSDIGDQHARALSALRLDLFGNKVWETTGFWWTLAENQTGREPWRPRIVSDSSGGAMVSWEHYNDAYTYDDIYAAGLGPDGNSPPLPSLVSIDPDAGSIGDIQQVTILGDYLRDDDTYTLVGIGGPDLVVTGVSQAGARQVTGTLNLGGAGNGPYDLSLTRGGNIMAALPDAYGVGDMVGCASDEPIFAATAPVSSFGSQRKMAFGPDGLAHAAWIDIEFGRYYLKWMVTDTDLSTYVIPLVDTSDVLRDLTLTVDDAGYVYFVYVQESGGTSGLMYRREAPGGGTDLSYLPLAGQAYQPVVAVTTDGTAHVIHQMDSGGGVTELFETTVPSGGVFTPAQNLGAGANATEPDLTPDGDGLMLTFVRDFWWPGTREVCYQRFDGSVWETPVGIYVGVFVNSPSVAWDRADGLLFSWILDNTGNDPLLHTLLMTGHVPGTVRWRLGLPDVHSCSVGAMAPGMFALMSMESDGGPQISLMLRLGNGDVFYPRRRINSTDDVDHPFLAVHYGQPSLMAMWDEYTDPTASLYRYLCLDANPVVAVDVPSFSAGFTAIPNPFNPRTSFCFGQQDPGWVKLELYDVSGRRVRTLWDGFLPEGDHAVAWDGREESGRRAAAGVYFGRLLLPGGHLEQVQKVMLVK